VDVGEINGFKLRFHLYTVPGQVFYNSTRRLVLKGADGVVFVADSQREALDSNIQSIKNLKQNLSEEGINLDQFPFVIQYNKRDLPEVLSLEELNEQLNERGVPVFEAAAVSGEGVVETLKAIGKVVVKDLRRSLSKREGIRTGEVSPVGSPSKESSEATVSAGFSRGSKPRGGVENPSVEEKVSATTQSSVSVSVDIKKEVPSFEGDKEKISEMSQKEEGANPQRIIFNLSLEIELEEKQGEWKPKNVVVKNLDKGES
jgi:signal recognition particle receptor subunit beta